MDFGHVDFMMLVANPSDTVPAIGYGGLKHLRRSGPEVYIRELLGYR